MSLMSACSLNIFMVCPYSEDTSMRFIILRQASFVKPSVFRSLSVGRRQSDRDRGQCQRFYPRTRRLVIPPHRVRVMTNVCWWSCSIWSAAPWCWSPCPVGTKKPTKSNNLSMNRFTAPLPAKRAHRPRQLPEETLEACVDLALIQLRLEHKPPRFLLHIWLDFGTCVVHVDVRGQELQSCCIFSPLLEDPPWCHHQAPWDGQKKV